jgi:superfamily I DNA/RNA helicase
MAETVLKMNPAEEASVRALEAIYGCLDRGESFRLEAGAGAGKTYTLVKALQYLIKRDQHNCRDDTNRSPVLRSPMWLRTK